MDRENELASRPVNARNLFRHAAVGETRERPGGGRGDVGGMERERLSVLHVCAPTHVGGLESVLHALATGHRSHGHDVQVAAVIEPDQEVGPFVTPLREGGVTLHLVELPARAYLAERRAIRDLLRAEEPDVLHTHGHRSDILDAGLARRRGIPTVATVHGPSRVGALWPVYEWLHDRVLPSFDAVVAVSSPLVRRLERAGVPSGRLHLLRNAWTGGTEPLPRDEARRGLGLPPEGFVIGWVGRLIPIKGADLFLRALARIRDLPWRASLIGDGMEQGRLEAEARALDLQDRLAFHGTLAEARRYYSAFDAFVLSSRSEGTPIVLFEAMAAGVPILATRVGGVPDVVSPAEALLVPPEDPGALARGIRAIMSDPAGARRRARAAADRLAGEFALEPWLRRYEAIYREVIRTRAASVPRRR